MHQDFADWYRVVSIEPREEDLRKRWKTIESLGETTAPADLFELVRLFYNLPFRGEQFLTKFRDAFKANDDVFPMRGNDAELQVLAGASLAHHFSYEEPWGSASALAVLSAGCQGLRDAPVPSIVALAEESLAECSASLRTVGADAESPRTNFDAELATLKAVFPQNTVASLAEPLTKILQALIGSVGLLSRLEKQQLLRTEESNVLWWLFGERSRDLERPFSKLDPPGACLIGAKELADMTTSLAGPFAAEAFLDKVLRLAHPVLDAEVSIAEAVTACPLEWQRNLIEADGANSLASLCPIHLAVAKCVEAEGKKTWHGPFQTLSGLKATAKLPPLGLALQTYRERLLLRAFVKLGARHV